MIWFLAKFVRCRHNNQSRGMDEAFGGAEHPAQRNERFTPGRDIDLQLFEKNATGVDR
jgi:hypothetical protein